MKKAIGLCVLAVFVCGSVSAVDFTWVATANTNYDCALAWSPNYRAPGSPTDAMFGAGDTLVKGGSGNLQITSPKTIYLGDFTLSANEFGGSNQVVTMYLLDDNGHSGNLTVNGTGVLRHSGSGSAYYVDGNVLIRTGGNSYAKESTTLTLQGAGKTIEDCNAAAWRKIIITSAASTTVTSAFARANSLDVQGALAGNVMVSDTTTGPTNGSVTLGGTWTSGLLGIKQMGRAVVGVARLGAGTYPNIDTLIAAETGGAQAAIFRHNTWQTGNVVSAGYLKFNANYQGYASDETWMDTWHTDDGSGNIYDLTVNGNLNHGGGASGATFTAASVVGAGFFANSSTIDINGNAFFGRYGYIKGGTSTWKFAGNVKFDRTIATGTVYRTGLPYFVFDNTDMSQTTVYLDGTGIQRVGFSSLLALNNLVVKKTAGGIVMLDNALIKGNFVVDPSTSLPSGYDDNGFYLIFQGGVDCETLAQQIDALGADLQKVHIQAGSSTFVKLMSNLTVSDNLDIDLGCKLFLNGFTLTAEGQTITSTTPWDQGEIVGAAPIPEPATLLLLGTGALGALGYIRRRRMN